jgi:hypothetical protein
MIKRMLKLFVIFERIGALLSMGTPDEGIAKPD